MDPLPNVGECDLAGAGRFAVSGGVVGAGDIPVAVADSDTPGGSHGIPGAQEGIGGNRHGIGMAGAGRIERECGIGNRGIRGDVGWQCETHQRSHEIARMHVERG